MNFGNATDIRMGQNTISALYFKNRKIWPRNPEEIYLVLTSEEDNNNFYINLTSNSLGSSTVTIEVSYDDGKHWQTFTSAQGSINIGTIDSGERICIRGLNDTYTFTNKNLSVINYNYFSSDGKFKASGNIMGLIYGKDADIYGTSLPNNTQYNFFKLFYNSKVTDISNLKMPATTLTEGCYGSMFENCDELERAYNFELPAITLSDYCYNNMFIGCDNLLDAPTLYAKTLTEGCYQYMFAGCGKLNYIKMLATDISATNCLDHWVGDVAPTGIFVKDFNLTSIPINSVNGIPVGWVYEETNVPDFKAVELTIQSSVANNTITYSGSDIEYLYYKIGDEADTYKDFPAAGVTINADEKLILRGELSTVLGTFASTGNFRVFGNIQSLNFTGSSSIACTGGLFKNCTGLTDARYLILSQATVPEKGYFEMFKGCTSLITAPKIEATKFGSSSLNSMFSGCTSLTTIRPFTIDSYAYYICSNMFEKCTSLTIVPEIIINYAGYLTHQYMFSGCTSLIDASRIKMPTNIEDGYAFRYMFNGCTNLKKVPVLPATKMRHNCYNSMFKDCISLEYAPVLPATTLANNCYFQMFSGCQHLKTCPELPATTLATGCYEFMFYNCISLTESPYLGASTLVDRCYRYMFFKCYKLDYIECLATDISASQCTYHWVEDVASSGTFVKDPNMKNWLMDSVDGIPNGWSDPDDWSTAYFNIKPVKYPCSVYFELRYGTSSTGISYSTDVGTTWNTLNEVGHSVNDGSYYMSLTLTNGSVSIKSDHWNYAIGCSTDYYARGNVMSLIWGDNFASQTTLKSDYQFKYLFNGQAYTTVQTFGKLLRAVDLYLPATTLTRNCYEGMFEGSNITKAPKLPATTMKLYCYKDMFKNSQLNNTPVLAGTTLATGCYEGMFEGTNIIYTPILNATTLAAGCYEGMFRNSEIRKISQNSLPATTMTDSCYTEMFYGCKNLVLTDTQYNNLLPATDLTGGWECYRGMFANCTSLTKTVKLPATTLEMMGVCYSEMFMGCTGITSFTGVKMTGEKYPVMLPATILSEYCYYHMFKGCTSLANSLRPGDTGYVRVFPTQHKIYLSARCFDSMFMGCTNFINPIGWNPDKYIEQNYLHMFEDCKSLKKKSNSSIFGTVYNPHLYEKDEHIYDGCTSIQNSYIALSEL